MAQSFLVIGSCLQAETQISELLKQYGISYGKTSPDLTIVAPIKKETTIGQVKEIKSTVFQKPVDLPYRVIIFSEAETLNVEAQNALLKILEEPPACALLILQTENPQNLLPTIHSRVVKVWPKREDPEASADLYAEPQRLFSEIPKIDQPGKWLKVQIALLTKQLKNQIAQSKWKDADKTSAQIQYFMEAKKMIDANVNPNFVLVNLAINLED